MRDCWERKKLPYLESALVWSVMEALGLLWMPPPIEAWVTLTWGKDFSVVAPQLWNLLIRSACLAPSLHTFKRCRKAEL